uniref:Nuclear receptor n=1 Tax=Brachionus rotundiformis TaxID=96890 RepID=A0A221CAX0_9BILA|nr:nuclear receptor [Brachionus rotundiformis]
MQNFAYNSNLPFDTSSSHSFSFGAQMNQQQLQLHLELQQQLNRTKKLNEDEYDYYDEEEYEDEPDEEDKMTLGVGSVNLKRPKGELTCVVCGASANGYNFDAITCESCKAFFRRNAFRPLNLFRCSNNNQCEINIQTRKKCKKCRIVKCFNLGMRRDWIMTEMEREEKRRKIQENRKKKTTDGNVSESMSQSEQSMPTPIVKPIRRRRRRRRHSLLDQKPSDQSRISGDEKKKYATDMTKQSPYNSTFYSDNQPQAHSLPNMYSSYPNTSSHVGTFFYENDDSKKSVEDRGKKFHTAAIYSTLSPQSITSQPPSNSSSPSLNEQEHARSSRPVEKSTIEAIRKAYKQAIQLVKAYGQPKDSDNINDTINLTELGVRRIIFYFKLISDFRNLNHDLMVKLLKQNMMTIIQIHGINSYNKEQNSFKEPETDDIPFSADSLKSVYGDEVYQKIINITINLHDLCQGDMVYIKLLMLIILFDPINDTLNTDERVMIKNLQDKYMNLTFASLCERMGCMNKANLVLKGMLFEVSKINDLAKWFERTVVEKSDSEFVRPLMKEVFSFPSDHTPPSSINSSSASSSVQSVSSLPPSSVGFNEKSDIKQEAYSHDYIQ